MRKFFMLPLIILLASCYTYGQLYPIIHWQIKNNLNIRANITSITQDKQGFIWHARGNKLYKIENENLYEQNGILGIEQLKVDYAISDKKGQLWIAADSALYLVKSGKAAKILKMNYRNFSEKSQTIVENPDGSIVLTGDEGAYKISKDTIIEYSDKNNLYKNSGTSGSNFINHKQYITSYGGLFELHNNKFLRHLIVPDTFDRKNDFRTITKFKNKIFVGTAQGLYEFTNGLFLPVTTTIKGNTIPTVNQAIVTSDEKLWLATQNGILIYDGITWTSITEKNGLRDLK